MRPYFLSHVISTIFASDLPVVSECSQTQHILHKNLIINVDNIISWWMWQQLKIQLPNIAKARVFYDSFQGIHHNKN